MILFENQPSKQNTAISSITANHTTNLELLELLLGDGIKDVCRVRVGSGALGHLEPILKPRVVVEELAPESPRLLDPTRKRHAGVTVCCGG